MYARCLFVMCVSMCICYVCVYVCLRVGVVTFLNQMHVNVSEYVCALVGDDSL